MKNEPANAIRPWDLIRNPAKTVWDVRLQFNCTGWLERSAVKQHPRGLAVGWNLRPLNLTERIRRKGKKTERYLAKNFTGTVFKCKKKQEKEPFSGRYKIIKYKKKRRNVLLFLPAGALFSVKHHFIWKYISLRGGRRNTEHEGWNVDEDSGVVNLTRYKIRKVAGCQNREIAGRER